VSVNKTDGPLVSVVTVCLNSERFLDDCLLSVRNQTYGNIEHIVIDGGSTDGTLAIIAAHEADEVGHPRVALPHQSIQIDWRFTCMLFHCLSPV